MSRKRGCMANEWKVKFEDKEDGVQVASFST